MSRNMTLLKSISKATKKQASRYGKLSDEQEYDIELDIDGVPTLITFTRTELEELKETIEELLGGDDA